MPDCPFPHVILVAHSSGMEEHDVAWKRSLLGWLGDELPGCKIGMEYIHGYSGHCPRLADESGGEVKILPLCLLEGMFLKCVVPEFVRTLPFQVGWLPPLVHKNEALWKLLDDRIASVMGPEQRKETDFVVISHGTRYETDYTPDEEDMAQKVPGFKSYVHLRLKNAGDDQPAEGCGTDMLLVPWFLTQGKHVMTDIPHAFGLPDGSDAFGCHSVGGRRIHYMPPIGTFPEIAGIIASIISESIQEA